MNGRGIFMSKKRILENMLFLLFSITLISCGGSSGEAPNSTDSNPKSPPSETSKDKQSSDTLTLPESEIEFDTALMADRNSFESSDDTKSSVEKTFSIHPKADGQLNIRVNFQTLDGRLPVPLYSFIFLDRNDQSVPWKTGPTGEIYISVKGSEVYRFKITLMSKQMKVTFKPSLDLAPSAQGNVQPLPLQSGNLEVPKKFSCIANEQFGGSYSVNISTELTSTPLVGLKSTESDLTFKIGRQFVGGEKIDPAMDYKCENKIEHTGKKYSLEYICRFYITDVDGSKKETHRRLSRFHIYDSGNGQVCKFLGSNGSRCWELAKCK